MSGRAAATALRGPRPGIGLILAAVSVLLVLAALFLAPLAAIMARGAGLDSGAGSGSFVDAWEGSNPLRLLRTTVIQAAGSTVLTAILGMPLAWLLARQTTIRRDREAAPGRLAGLPLRVLVTLPFVLPTLVVGAAFRVLFADAGPLGFLGWSETIWAVLVAHAYLNLTVIARIVGPVWASLGASEVAAVLGAGPIRAFLTVTLPQLRGAIAAAMVIVFLYCTTSFAVILMVGGTRFETLETGIYTAALSRLDLTGAALLAVLQLLLVVATLLVAGRMRTGAPLRARPAQAPSGRSRLVAALVAAGYTTAVFGPLLVLARRSLEPVRGEWGIAAFGRLTDPVHGVVPIRSLLLSLQIALQATIFALIVGTAATLVGDRLPRGSRLRSLTGVVVALPLGVSAVTLGFGYILLLAHLPVGARTSPVLVPLVQGLVAIPLIVQVLSPAVAALDPRLRSAAAGLGASPIRVARTIDLPLLWRSVAAAAGLAFVVTLGEFGAASFLVQPNRVTFPVFISQAMGRPGSLEAATGAAAALLLVAIAAAGVTVIEALALSGSTEARRSIGPKNAGLPAPMKGGGL